MKGCALSHAIRWHALTLPLLIEGPELPARPPNYTLPAVNRELLGAGVTVAGDGNNTVARPQRSAELEKKSPGNTTLADGTACFFCGGTWRVRTMLALLQMAPRPSCPVAQQAELAAKR